MSKQETDVLIALANVWNMFNALPIEHPDDRNDFRYHIHRLQDMIAARPALRKFNNGSRQVRQKCDLCFHAMQSVQLRDGHDKSLCINCYNLLTK